MANRRVKPVTLKLSPPSQAELMQLKGLARPAASGEYPLLLRKPSRPRLGAGLTCLETPTLMRCESAWGPDADRQDKPLIHITLEESRFGADLQAILQKLPAILKIVQADDPPTHLPPRQRCIEAGTR